MPGLFDMVAVVVYHPHREKPDPSVHRLVCEGMYLLSLLLSLLCRRIVLTGP